ncbi:transposable element Tcb1 transposase [Trichonephila clavipes]|nr:transposable element Tcb1 transposase [Trichonephila clavipes]
MEMEVPPRSAGDKSLRITNLELSNDGHAATQEQPPKQTWTRTAFWGHGSLVEGTTDRRGRSHPPQCTTSREDRQIVRMAVTDRSIAPRTVAQHTESVTHHSVSARTIRRRLQQSGLSARRPLLVLPLTLNHRRLRRQMMR